MANKRYQCGLVVGKFSPLHKGHEYLIQTARDSCSHLVLISYSRPEFPSCSMALREKWLKIFMPDATVLCIDAPTIEQWRNEQIWSLPMPFNTEGDKKHREFTAKILNKILERKIDAVFTSEYYGEGFTRYLSKDGLSIGANVEHVCVDINRLTIPASGTLLRSYSESSTAQLSTSVMKNFNVKKICFLGGESTGKTTLTNMVGGNFNEPIVEEYGRTLWEKNNGLLTQDDLLRIAKTQTANEEIAQLKADKYIICDTSPLTTLCYSEVLFKTRPSILEAFAETPYHQIFLSEPDFPFIQDGTRKNEKFREWQHNWYLNELKKRQIPYILLNGSIEKRINRVKKELTTSSIS